jgi:lipoprotein-anchoring transpeptidase ErfK/SrfK
MNLQLTGKRVAYACIVLASGAFLASTEVQAQVLAMASDPNPISNSREVTFGNGGAPGAANEAAAVPARFHRQIVYYQTTEAPGTIIVDTPNTYLYFILGGGKAIRYGIGVGREGFTWSGVKSIERKSEWPDWIPPADMLARQPYLPRFMAGGPGNPLGARAMYLSGTVYRIHGTNKPSSIGTHVSSGCIRMLNADVTDLYERARVGTKVVVLPMTGQRVAQDRVQERVQERVAIQPATPGARMSATIVREEIFAPSLR